MQRKLIHQLHLPYADMEQMPFGICPYCGDHLTPAHKCFEIGEPISRKEAIEIANKILADSEFERLDND